MEDRKAEIVNIADENEALQCQVTLIQAEKYSLESEKTTLESATTYLSDRIDTLSDQLRINETENTAEIAGKDQEISHLNDAIEVLTAERDDIQLKFDTIRHAIRTVATNRSPPASFTHAATTDDDIAFLERGISETVTELRQTLSERDAEIVTLQEEIQRIRKDRQDTTQHAKSTEKEIVRLQKHIQQLECTIDDFNDEKVSLNSSAIESQDKVWIT